MISFSKTLSLNQMIENNGDITNREALRDHIHDIHNYIRNSGIGYGMTALAVFNVLFGLSKIEESNLFDKCELTENCRFSNLVRLAKNRENEKLTENILGIILDELNGSKIKHILFYEIPQNIVASMLGPLILKIDDIKKIEQSCHVLLSGKIYEYFIGRDKQAISELGAYFTDRHIVDYIYEKLQPTLNEEGNVRSMIDMFGGSGGFTTGYVNFLNKKYNSESNTHPLTVNWETNINNVHHHDVNRCVIRSAGLELFCLTGKIPTGKTIKCENAFTNNFGSSCGDAPENGFKYHYIITNPPYGGDKKKKSTKQLKNEKIVKHINSIKNASPTQKEKFKQQLLDIKQYEKNNDQNEYKVNTKNSSRNIKIFAELNNIKGNDKESVSFMLLMDRLEEGGTCCAVLKEGVFFNRTYKQERKTLLTNFNVREIISVPQNQFENTSTKTSIVIFDNTEEKTSVVRFSDLEVEKYTKDKFHITDDGKVVLLENEGDIKQLNEINIKMVSIEEIKVNKLFSLNGKDYQKKDLVVGVGYELKTLGELCTFNPPGNKKKQKTFKLVKIKDIDNNKIINYDTINDEDVKNTNICSYGDIIVSNVRPKSSKSMILTPLNAPNIEDICFTLPSIRVNEGIDPYYIFGIIYPLLNTFEKDLCKRTSYPGFNPSQLESLKIPFPTSQEKMIEWVDKIKRPYDEMNEKRQRIEILEKEVRDRITNITENEECENMKLGDICKIKCGTMLSKKQANTGVYKVYGGGGSSYTHDTYNMEGFNIVISRVGSNSISLINEKFFLTDNGFSLIFNKVFQKYLGYYFKHTPSIISILGIGTNQHVISKTTLSELSVRVPINRELITEMEPMFQELERLQQEVQEAEKLYKQYIKELSHEAMPELKIVEENEEEENSSEVNLENTFEECPNGRDSAQVGETESDITSIISHEDDKIYTSKELNDKKTTLTILKTICKNKKIKKYSKLKKAGLIDIILKEQ
jgi:type I restriction-modification system DNA methylase subunit